MRSIASLAALVLVLSLGCTVNSPVGPRRDGSIGEDGGTTTTSCSPGTAVVCRGTTEVLCNPDGTEGTSRDCGLSGSICAPGLGCRVCVPSRPGCIGTDSGTCRADGSGYDVTRTCDAAAGESCIPATGLCDSPCAAAEASNSYIGCEYWPVPTLNGVSRDDFDFAVVVSNPQAVAATVTVTRGGVDVLSRVVAAGAVETISLPWIDALQASTGELMSGMRSSALVRGGAYRLRSTQPVTVYQFNPLEFRIPRDCPSEIDQFGPGAPQLRDGQCHSFSNDASLLLPTHVLTGNYLATAFPSHMIEASGDVTGTLRSPGFVAIVGVEATPVTVTVVFSAPVLASSDGVVAAFTAGSTGTFTLGQGDVLQLASGFPGACTDAYPRDELRDPFFGTVVRTWRYCDTSAYDLTGTDIRATGRVAVIGGHECSFVPQNRWACDHLEEMNFPLETWGDEAIVSVTQPVVSEPNIIRIISSHDANSLSFNPPGVHAPVTLARGEIIEFGASASFRVTGTDAFAAIQLLVGQNFDGIESMAAEVGDPSLSLAIPTAQFRTSYSFLAPTSYTRNMVNVTAPSGATVMLDGAPVAGFVPVSDTGYGVARLMITGGAHSITGTEEFGIVVYGFGSYTSYMYPGGLDLEAIDIPF